MAAARSPVPCFWPESEGDAVTKERKGSVSQETFDVFLANQGMLEACEDRAIKEIIAEQLAGVGASDLAWIKGDS